MLPSDQLPLAFHVRALRTAAGLTVEQLANRAGLTPRLISNLEQGKGKPLWETVCQLARALGVSVAMFDQPIPSTVPATVVTPQISTIRLHCDGSCEPVNPGGTARWGWVAYCDDQQIAEDCGCVGTGAGMTNNLAEYHGAVNALEWAKMNAAGRHVILRSDSKLLVNQVNGNWQVKAMNLKLLRDKAAAPGCRYGRCSRVGATGRERIRGPAEQAGSMRPSHETRHGVRKGQVTNQQVDADRLRTVIMFREP